MYYAIFVAIIYYFTCLTLLLKKMKKYLSILAIASLLFSSCGSEESTNDTSDTTKTEVASESKTVLKIDEFYTTAAENVDKEIQVKGIVDHVCRHGGKKLFLVDDGGDLHVFSENRFNDSVMGSEIIVTGIVREFKMDEAYCSQLEEDNIKSHSEGNSSEEQFKRKQAHVAEIRDSMKAAGVDHISEYSLEYISYK